MKTSSVLLAVVLLCFASTASMAQLSNYSQDFEGLVPSGPGDPDQLSLANDGWLFFANVFNSGGDFLYPYSGSAPNGGFGGPAISAVVTGEGGGGQGAQQVSIFSDYNNGDHVNTDNLIEINVFQEQNISAADLGETYTFSWDHKAGNIEGATTAAAFIKVLDPNTGFGLSGGGSVDTTNIPATWGGDSISVTITPAMIPGGTGPDGHILQFGFVNTASNSEGSGIFYDNVVFSAETTAVPMASNVALIIFALMLAATMAIAIAVLSRRGSAVA